jgi:hypothetical protein
LPLFVASSVLMPLSYRWTYGPHDLLHIQDTTWNVYYNRLIPNPVCIQSRWYQTVPETENVFKVQNLPILLKIIPLVTPFMGEPTIPPQITCVLRPRECCLIRDHSTRYIFYVRVYQLWSGDLYSWYRQRWTVDDILQVAHFYLTALLQFHEQHVVHTNITLSNTLYYKNTKGHVEFCLVEPSNHLYRLNTPWPYTSYGTPGYLQGSRGYNMNPNHIDDHFAVSMCLRYLLRSIDDRQQQQPTVVWTLLQHIIYTLQSNSNRSALVRLLTLTHGV